MKKTLLLKTMLLLCAIIVGSTSVKATDVVYYTLDGTITSGGNSNYGEDGGGLTQNSISWSVTGNTTINPWRIGGKNLDKVDRAAYSKTAMGAAITKLELELGGITLSAVNSITLTVASNADFSTVTQTIEKTSITANSTLTFEPSSGSAWAKDAYYKIVFNVTAGSSNSYVQLKSAKFYKEASASQVVTPTFNPVAGEYKTKQDVAINCGTADAKIYYTTNGNDPTESDALYTSAVSITKSGTTLKAKAFKEGMTASEVASAVYTIKPNNPTITAAGATVTISGDDGLSFYYTTDNSAPTNESTAYTAPFELDANCTIKAIGYDTYGNASGVTSLNYKYMPLNPKNINSGYYEKVTDVSTLENGDAILIVNEDAEKAMSTTQNNNNRGTEAITISNGSIYAPSAKVQEIILVKKKETIEEVETDVFYFYTGSGYLYAASGSSNHLKTETTPDNNNNARATIYFDNGDAIVTFTGTSSHNVMQFNSTLFSCYESDSQSPIQIYKEVAKNATATIPAGKEWITFCSPYNLDFTSDIAGLEGAYTITAHENQATTLTATKMTGKVKAGTGLLLRAAEKKTTAQAITIPIAATGDDQADNMLKGVTEDTNVQPTDGTNTNLGLSNGEFHPYSAAGTLAAGKAYLQVPTAQMPTGGNNARLYIVLDSEATGIANLNVNDNDNIDANAPMYNLAGQRVNKSYKGVVIVNGKKYINK